MSNPIRVLLVSAAAGRPPKPADLDQLPLAADTATQVRAEVEKTLHLVRALRHCGMSVEAHRLAVVAAADMRRFLDPDQGGP